jgi:methylated-DNA-[protein]-cysteine S-methyltransferase
MIPAPFGGVRIAERFGAVVAIELMLPPVQNVRAETVNNKLLREARDQLMRYFHDPALKFSLPLELAGTAFQRRVWSVTLDIPAGQTKTYGGLSALIGGSPRAVAGACRANRLPILMPCHRIVGAHGLGGYCGSADGPMLAVKSWLLQHEARRFD